MKNLATAIPFLFLTACFVGRTSNNEPLEAASIASLKPGTTTAKDVTAMFGAPVDVVQLGKRSAYLYRHTMEKTTGALVIVVGLFNDDIRSDRLWVFFDARGVLTHYGSTLQAKRTERTLPWAELHEEEDEDEDEETS